MRLKYQILAIGLMTFTLIFLQPVYAQICSSPDDPSKFYTKGLASTPNLGSNLRQTADSKCIVDPKAAFAPYKIPSYDDLKSIYYTQSKAIKVSTRGDGTQSTFSVTVDTVYYLTGNFNLSGNPSGSGTFVVFVDGNLNITNNYCYGASNCLDATLPAAQIGTVFIIKGDVNIAPTVTRIDAIIIAQGNIYTAGSGCSHSSPVLTSQPLTVYGSLISLLADKKIEFCRELANNNEPAEKIIHQPKYLVILRNLMSDTLQKWSEIQ